MFRFCLLIYKLVKLTPNNFHSTKCTSSRNRTKNIRQANLSFFLVHGYILIMVTVPQPLLYYYEKGSSIGDQINLSIWDVNGFKEQLDNRKQILSVSPVSKTQKHLSDVLFAQAEQILCGKTQTFRPNLDFPQQILKTSLAAKAFDTVHALHFSLHTDTLDDVLKHQKDIFYSLHPDFASSSLSESKSSQVFFHDNLGKIFLFRLDSFVFRLPV